MRLLKYLIPVVAIVSIFFIIRKEQTADTRITHARDYTEIAAEGLLRVATEYNSISFFIQGDTFSGFHYELIQAFAHSKGMKTSITPVMSIEERQKGLYEGTYDLIATNIQVTNELKDSFLLTTPIIRNKQVLVQRKKQGEKDSTFIHNQLQLAKHTIHVVKGSPSIMRIQNLSEEIGDTIFIREIEKYGPEQLISMVAYGDIDYAVCEESIAKIMADSLPQIDIQTAISFTQFYAWAVSKQSPMLLDSLNTWLNNFQKSKEYLRIYRKYYK